MSISLQRLLLLSILMIAVPAIGSPPDDPTRLWTFDNDPPQALPTEFQVGTLFDGRPAGEWKVLETDRAPSPSHVLAQLMGKGAEHAYKTVLLNGIAASDIDLAVSFLPISGKADMGGGLIWRATDDRNYYLTRANPLEQNIRVYRVVKGVRHVLRNFDQIIDIRQWHSLRVVTKGCQVQVFFDEKPVFDLCDQTFTSGHIGLWTKSDAITYFDDLKLQIVR
ncbi:MAG: hypothetical protein H8K03_08465 [Nitrospira sp.]|nr:hypothetical protein [Nitrospira sp. BO4]